MTLAKGTTKPRKPRGCPLTPHASGQWVKWIHGRLHYFGKDLQTALEQYRQQSADLHAGREVSVQTADGSIKDMVNRYLAFQTGRLGAGEIGPRWFEDCRRILTDFGRAVGVNRSATDLRPDDFEKYRACKAKHLGVHSLTKTITAIKGLFKYAIEAGLLEHSPRYGHGFRKPTAAQKRRSQQRAERSGKNLFAPNEIRQIITASPTVLRGAILLGINGGFGNTDCGTLPRTAIDLDRAVIDYARPKTGIRRIVPLWPETVAALRTVLDASHTRDQDAAGLVFVTETGRPLVRQRQHYDDSGQLTKVTYMDRLGDQFDTVLQRLSLKRRGIGFYTLRRTFRTIADEVPDPHAIHLISGHTIPGMSGIYVREISMDRLRAVVDHVRSKVFGDAN